MGGGALALGTLSAPALAQQRRRLVVVTGGTGGVFFPYGGGIAKILSEKMANVQATAQVTGGSVDNIKLMHQGEAEIGFSTIDSAFVAINGEGAYKAEGKQDVRTLAVLYDSFFHVVASVPSGVTNVASLRGKRVSVGSAGSSTEGLADRVIEAAGLNPMRDVGRDNLGVAESAGAMKDGKIAAFFWIGGVPTPAVRDLATSGQPAIRFVDTTAELAGLERKWPGLYRANTLPANAYAGQTAAVPGLGVANILMVPTKLPNDVVTLVLEGIFGNLEEVQKIHPEARGLNLRSAASKTAVPFHPAAEAFYRARGVTT
jgi:TRAP transporter TAXI family solute receptor